MRTTHTFARLLLTSELTNWQNSVSANEPATGIQPPSSLCGLWVTVGGRLTWGTSLSSLRPGLGQLRMRTTNENERILANLGKTEQNPIWANLGETGQKPGKTGQKTGEFGRNRAKNGQQRAKNGRTKPNPGETGRNRKFRRILIRDRHSLLSTMLTPSSFYLIRALKLLLRVVALENIILSCRMCALMLCYVMCW